MVTIRTISKTVDAFSGASTVDVRSLDGRPLPLQVDGDYLGCFEQVSFGVEPCALRVVA